MKKIKFVALTSLLVFIICLGIIEVFFRIFDPLNVRQTPKRLYESRIGKDHSYTFYLQQPYITKSKVDPYIKVTRNSLGFRGDEPSLDHEQLKIIAMGGSTTECIVLSDGQTWSDLLQTSFKNKGNDIWIGNAGVNGQSSFGHVEFFRDYVSKLRPKIVLFLMGANEQNEYYMKNGYRNVKDFGIGNQRNFVKIPPQNTNYEISISTFVEKYKEHSKLLLNISEYLRRKIAKELNLDYQHNLEDELKKAKEYLITNNEFETDLKKLEQKEIVNNRAFEELELQKDYQINVKENLISLIEIARENNILPIFITQPSLFGPGIDPITKLDMEKIIIQSSNTTWGQGLTGKEMWTLLNHYNGLIKEIANTQKIPLIDLASKLERNSSFYYDYIHFSKRGASEVSKIISKELCVVLNEHELLSGLNCSMYN